MEIKKAEFVRSISRGGRSISIPGLPEIAMAGEIQCGEVLAHQHAHRTTGKLARVSQDSPERRALINYFLVEQQRFIWWLFRDMALPGFPRRKKRAGMK